MEIVLQLLLAIFLGALIGLEREFKKKEAGLQTYSLVGLGTCLFTLITFSLVEEKIFIDPAPLILALALGMGFIGAGAIFRGKSEIAGLTTTAGLWTTSAIGFAVGAKLYFLAFLSTALVLLILAGLGLLEKKIFKK